MDATVVSLSPDSVDRLASAIFQKAMDPGTAGQIVSVYGPMVAAWMRPAFWFAVGVFVGAVAGVVFFRMWRG